MKKVISLVLAVVLLASAFAGCGTKSKNVGSNNAEIDISKPVTLTWYLHGSTVSDDSAVLAKANEYLKEKLNVTLKPIWGTWGDFDTNSVLAINGADDVDIYFTCSWTANEYSMFAKKGAWVRLDDPENNLIEKYAKDLWNILPSVLVNGAKVKGSDEYGTYGVPGYKDSAVQNCWDINVPLLEKYGYTVDDIKNTDYYGFGDILAKVKAGEGDNFYPLLVEGAVLERMVNNTIIVTGDAGTNNVLSHYINPTDASEGPYGNTILNKFATPEYKKFVEKTREYYLAGYIDPAMSNPNQANDTRTNKQLTGNYLIGTQSYSLGYEHQATGERGFKVAMVPTTPAFVDTTTSQGALMAISSTSKNPERALMFLNLLNTDPYLMTLLNFGIEGEHYNIVNGEAIFTEKRESYKPWTNGMGNITQLPPTEGQGADFQKTFKAYYGSAKEISILGFMLDQTSITNELGALANVAGEYALALSTGSVDPAVALPEFLKKLEDNGMTKVVDEANNQLKVFMEEKNK
jgi:putative aldouronate transport system substrate-binding protein